MLKIDNKAMHWTLARLCTQVWVMQMPSCCVSIKESPAMPQPPGSVHRQDAFLAGQFARSLTQGASEAKVEGGTAAVAKTARPPLLAKNSALALFATTHPWPESAGKIQELCVAYQLYEDYVFCPFCSEANRLSCRKKASTCTQFRDSAE